MLCRKKMNVFSTSTLYVFPFYHSLPTWCSTARFLIQFSRVIFDMSVSQDNMKNLPNKIGPENFLYYIVSWSNNYFKLWLRKEQFFVVEKWHFVQNRFLLFVSLLSSFFIFFHTDKNDYYHQQLTSSGILMNEQERERHIKQNKICEGCFSHVQTLTSLVRWLNKFFSFNASLVWV